MKWSLAWVLWSSGPIVTDADPWPVYLSESRFRASFIEQAAEWTSCEADEAELRQRVALTLDGSGRVRALSPREELSGCWIERLNSLDFGTHPEPESHFVFTVMATQGRPLSLLGLERVVEEAMLDFVHLPLGAGTAEAESIRRMLGLASDAPHE